MSTKKIKMNLSSRSIRDTIRQLEDYKKYLHKRCEIFTRMVAEQCAMQVNAYISASDAGTLDKGKAIVEVSDTGQIIRMRVAVESEGILFIEFGSGIHYNKGNENPKQGKDGLNYGVGTYPGQTHAFDENGWYYFDEDSQSYKHSYGVRATMPMFKASQKIASQIYGIAKAAFS